MVCSVPMSVILSQLYGFVKYNNANPLGAGTSTGERGTAECRVLAPTLRKVNAYESVLIVVQYRPKFQLHVPYERPLGFLATPRWKV